MEGLFILLFNSFYSPLIHRFPSKVSFTILTVSGYRVEENCFTVVLSPTLKGEKAMNGAMSFRNRPCRICRRWFMPDPRLKGRQMTCGDAACQREWHRRTCKAWNKNNAAYFRANYLQKKLDTASESLKVSKSTRSESRFALPTKRSMNVRLPLEVVQEVISIQQVVIIEYFGQLLIRRFQEALRRKPIVNTSKMGQLLPTSFSRGDGH